MVSRVKDESPAIMAGRLPTPTSFAAASSMAGTSTTLATREETLPRNDVRHSSPLTHRLANGISTPKQTSSHHDSGLHLVGKDIKVLVDAIDELRKFDLNHVAPLPMLVLVGDQSAGKSSLMGALAEIHLPRSQGCCTKCPANIKTSPAPSWSCTVSLQQSYSYDAMARQITLKDVTSKRPFPPWHEQVMVTRKFKDFTERAELEEAIRWAQIALLNHDVDYRDFIPGKGRRALDNDTSTVAGFSPNVVLVEISGPGLPALSFFDLPGLVQNTSSTSDRYLIKVFENLARKYIAHENALIIYALTMSVDPVLSRTGMVINDLKANDRCIGILTKPDTLADRTGHADFEDMLRGVTHQVGHGYFVTKQPGPNSTLQPGDDYHQLARQEEHEFFEHDPLWRNDWACFRDRCGTECIQAYLSQQLAVQIARSIPSITAKINARIVLNDEERSKLPEIPETDVQSVVRDCLQRFRADVESFIGGNGQTWEDDFEPLWNELSRTFCSLIYDIKPKIKTEHPADHQEFYDLTGDDDDVISVASTPTRRNGGNDGQSPGQAKRIKSDETDAPNGGGPRTPSRVNGTALRVRAQVSAYDKTPFAQFAHLGSNFIGLAGIRTTINRYNRPGMPGTINDRIYTELALQATTVWKAPLEVLLNETMAMLRIKFQRLLEKHLGHYRQTDLYRRSTELVLEKLDELGEHEREDLTALYELETLCAYTVNKTTFDERRVKEEAVLRAHRTQTRVRIAVERDIRQGTRRYGRSDPAEQRILKNRWMKEYKLESLPEDPAKDEMRVATWIRAYYMTAAQRFTDAVCLHIYGRLFHKARRELQYYLEDRLNIHGVEGRVNCQRLMGEDPSIAIKRQALRQEHDNLQLFSDRLARLEMQWRGIEGKNASMPSVESSLSSFAMSPTAPVITPEETADHDMQEG